MRQNPHVRICGGPGSATTLVYPTSRRQPDDEFETDSVGANYDQSGGGPGAARRPGNPAITLLFPSSEIGSSPR